MGELRQTKSRIGRQIDGYHVELPGRIAKLLLIALYRFFQLLKLFPIDSFFWGAESYVGTGFDFAYMHSIVFLRNDVNLAISRVEVRFDDAVAFFREMHDGDSLTFFAALPAELMKIGKMAGVMHICAD